MGGRSKFRFSNIIPIAWFYKLRNMNQNLNNKHPSSSSSSSLSSSSLRATSSSSSSSTLSSSSSSSLSVPQHTHHVSHNRTSQYFKRDLTTPPPSNLATFECQNSGHIPQFSDTQLPDSPSKRSRRRRSTRGNRVLSPRRRIISPVVTKSPKPNSAHEKNRVTPTHDDKSLILKDSNFGKLLDLELPPIVTKKNPKMNLEKETKTQDGTPSKTMNWSVRRLSVSSPRMKRNHQAQGKKSRRSSSRLSESFAVVKSSVNPQKDFMESMVEMIVENEIKGSKDLEDLLACYLQLNSDEYHQLIIDVFKQIWFTVAAGTPD